MTSTYFSTLSWYQPKVATEYSLLQRYGKSDKVGVYCMQGSGTTTYFSPPEEVLSLQGGLALATGVAGLLTSFIAF